MNQEILKRLKSFGWRFLCIALVAGLSWGSENLGLLEVPVWAQGVVGLVLGEITKWLNNSTNLFGAKLK